MLSMLFRMPPIVYYVLAPLALAAGIFAYFSTEADDAERRKALSHAPPTPIALERFDPIKNKADYAEVTIDGQLDVAKIVDVTKTRDSRTVGQVTVAPLYATDAKDRSAGMKAVVVYDARISDEKLKSMIQRDGAFGPIVRVGGVATTDSELIADAKQALADKGGTPANVLFIKPYIEGRQAALETSGGSGFYAAIAGLIVALALGAYGFVRSKQV